MEIITANTLGDGRVVFQTVAGWTHDVHAAEILFTKEAIAAALDRANADAAANRVVEPYAVGVEKGSGGLTPTRLRERIRAAGPTTGNSLPSHAAAPAPDTSPGPADAVPSQA